MAPFYRGFETKPRLNEDDIKAIQVMKFKNYLIHISEDCFLVKNQKNCLLLFFCDNLPFLAGILVFRPPGLGFLFAIFINSNLCECFTNIGPFLFSLSQTFFFSHR